MTTLPNFNHNTQPVGTVTFFAGGIAQSAGSDPGVTQIEAFGWMVCDGRLLNADQYPELFAALGYAYGGEDTQFNIPKLSNVPAGGSNTLKYIIKFAF